MTESLNSRVPSHLTKTDSLCLFVERGGFRLFYDQNLVRFDVGHPLNFPGRPGDLDEVDYSIFSQTEMHTPVAGTQITSRRAHDAILLGA